MDLPSIDGPHTADSTAATAALLAEAVRVLNHATLPDRAADSLPYPSDVARLLGHLGTALERLPQLLHQLSARVRATDGLHSTDGRDPHEVATELAVALARAVPHLDAAGEEIRHGRAFADRLGVVE